jgi:quinoprotein glucose dehydrogenase
MHRVARGGRGGAPADAPDGPDGPPPPQGPPQIYRKVTPEGGRFWQPDTKYSCAPPPWGELVAVDAATGNIAWRTPLGKFEELEAKGIPTTGAPNIGGAISTAGDLVFIGATIDGYFRAFDARNGRRLWEEKLTAPAHSIPSTYMGRDGKQYVVVAAGGGGFLNSPRADELIAWKLP